VIKRDLGIKDMSHVIPGHGGLMDRLDSLLATCAPIWLLLHYAVL
jgi:phosphatidate cytidylyltransferase